MPTSTPFNIPFIIQTMVSLQPKRVLDIGIGTGTYGFLLRQYLDIVPGRLAKQEWQVHIHGIEIFPQYHNPVWDHYYDRVMIGDAMQLIEQTGNYDAVLIADVIEHFEKEAGLMLLEKLSKKSQFIVVTSPAGNYPQGSVYGNVHECHLSSWNKEDFGCYACLFHPIGTCFIAVISSNAASLKSIDFHLPRLIAPLRRPPVNWRRAFHKVVGQPNWDKLVALKHRLGSR